MADNIQRAEKRGYNKGYNAGRQRRCKAITDEQRQRKENAFWQRAYIAAIPAAISAQGWVRGDKPINSVPDRMSLAAEFADAALTEAKYSGKLYV